MEVQRAHFSISTDPSRLDISMIHDYLCNHSYWAAGIPEETVRAAVDGALCFGIFYEQRQIGFARVISDYATIAYLGDVFILPEYRGQGLSKWLMEVVVGHPALQGLRRWILATADAHGLYARYGFQSLARPERWMEKHDPDVYRSK